ncbi:OmpW/AlkL family protein [Sinimarinibacterium flocculans]|uniref:Outer membrane protein n=1 Tax=Sinimarinibacterium flocculans TaxID=985250 RepID=A0A318E3E0_9GAMM|nr:OmpW family outer membrane protein [Sinimarinibacterium flocculans]PXV65668.1 outer membrane protein [Sinimarinibacterium flocculans]
MQMQSMLAAAALLAAGIQPGIAQAQEDSRWLVRTTAITVLADASSDVLDLSVDDQTTLAIDATYFATPTLGINVLAAFMQPEVKSGVAGPLGSVGLVPPIVTAQLHLGRAQSAFRPYVGAGFNYNIFHGGSGQLEALDVDVDDSIGFVLQIGANYHINDNVSINADIRYLRFNADVTVGANPALNDKLEFEGFILGAGLGFWL